MSGNKVFIASHGSRGDVQPFIALAYGLTEAGFEATLFTNPDHQKLVEDLGVSFISNGLPFKEFFTSDDTAKANTTNDFLKFLDGMGAHNAKHGPMQYELFFKALASIEPQLVIASTQHWTDCIWIPILFRIPAIPFCLNNSMTMDPYKAPFGLPSLPFGMNNLIWKLVISKWRDGATPIYKKLADLSGRKIDDFFGTTDEMIDIFAGFGAEGSFPFLPLLIAQDTDFQGTHHTDTSRHVYTGNLTLPVAACKGDDFGDATNTALANFIDSCSTPPVYIGWGSLVVVSAKWMSLMAVRTLKAGGFKGIVLGGWAGVRYELLDGETDSEELKVYCKDNVMFVDTAAHEALFPQCSVIVHHGGIGTTTAGVKSGRPNVITPIFYDQFDSAMLCARCGQGVDAGALPKLTPEQLAGHINKAMHDESMIKTASELAAKMRERDGLKMATEYVSKFLREDVASGAYWDAFDAFAAQKRYNNKSLFSKYFACAPCVSSAADIEVV